VPAPAKLFGPFLEYPIFLMVDGCCVGVAPLFIKIWFMAVALSLTSSLAYVLVALF